MKYKLHLALTSCLFAQTSLAGGLADPIIPTPVPAPPAPIAVPLDW